MQLLFMKRLNLKKFIFSLATTTTSTTTATTITGQRGYV